jgi:hypothetical protein
VVIVGQLKLFPRNVEKERRKGQEMMRGNHETKAVDAEMKPSDGVYYAKKIELQTTR